jgi:SAM-dependent methyltransferase
VARAGGTRGGQEQELFAKYLPRCAILGTEIAPTAVLFPLTVCWDFHDPLWTGLCDFVYSNSLDHAADPKRALKTWLASLVPGGVLIIEWGSYHEEATETDPFGATIEELLTLVEKCGGEIVDIEDAAAKSDAADYLKLVYVQMKGGKKNDG